MDLTLVSPSVFEDVVPKVLQRDLQRCKTFSYLKRLHLGEWFLHGGCYPLICFLRHSPGIEKVVLQLDESGDDDYERLPNADAEIDPPCVEAVKMLVVKNLEKSQSTATHRMIKEPRSSCASYQGIFALFLISKSSPLKFRFRMVICI